MLEPGGRLAVCVLHPFAEAGSFASRAPDEPFVVTGSYFEQRHYKETFERDGLAMTFSSSTHTLEGYARALESAGLLIESIREPQAPRAAASRDPGEERWRRVPIFLFLNAVVGLPA